MKEKELTHIDGNQLFFSFLSGASKIFDNQNYINKINVFPVADADTGTNLASTMRAIVETATPSQSVKLTAESISDAALTGARGNSGIIFAQFLYGFSNELNGEEKLSIKGFSSASNRAVKYAYDAIADPKEGTMISVIREWAEYLHELLEKENINSYYHLLTESLKKAYVSLKETTKKMDKLAKAKVVDAGAQGFVNFLEGMLEYFKTGKTPDMESLKAVVIEADEHIDHDEITFRYCTEALIKGEDLSKEKVKGILNGFGDSMVIAGATTKMRIHIHTDTPWLLFEKLSKISTIIAQKVDDMVLQNDIAANAKAKIGLVTDSSVDLPKDMIEKYQIQVVPLNIHFGETYYLDGITMQPEQFYTLLDKSPVYPTTSQPSYKDFYNRYNYLSTHFDSIIGINLSAKLSGTWQNSLNAANKVSEQTGKNIEVLNSKKVSAGMGLITLRTARAIESGMSHDELVAMIPMWALKTKQFASLKTLKYLMKSGRISRGRGLIGNLLNLKPVIEVNSSGVVENIGKKMSNAKSRELMLDQAKQYLKGKKLWGYAITHANNPETADWLAIKMEALTGKKPEFTYTVTPVLIAHVGIGSVSLSLMLE
ncbi:MAG: DegV family EDD domain-containing protein [Bacteroidales bacterium]|nr:DegV family EDD domain-containing protein [Bacteroidales bacterium]